MMTLAMVRGKRGRLLDLAARHGARNVRVFGSVARGEADPASDLDLLVDLEPGRSLIDLGALLADLEASWARGSTWSPRRGCGRRCASGCCATPCPCESAGRKTDLQQLHQRDHQAGLQQKHPGQAPGQVAAQLGDLSAHELLVARSSLRKPLPICAAMVSACSCGRPDRRIA